jgi:hypothetical protein
MSATGKMPTDKVRSCRGCSRQIHLLSTAEGSVIPLDLASPVYEITVDFAGQRVARKIENAYVTHFASCPKANDFSKSKRPRV